MKRPLALAGSFLLGWLASSSQGQQQQIEQKPPVDKEKYNYGQVLYLSMLFYEAQRSGKLPLDNRIPWRKSANLADGQDVNRDLEGGWYDAGDFVKFGWPMAYSVTTLSWGLLEYWDSYQNTGELEHMLGCIKWPLDYLLKAHSSIDELYVQIGNGDEEHAYWGPPEKEDWIRPSMAVNATDPGTEPVADAAAAMAAGFLAFKDHDSVYAQQLLDNAKKLFDFAYQDQAIFNGSMPFYASSSGFGDELAFAAAWLFKATGDHGYIDKASKLYTACCANTSGAFAWENKGAGVQVLMYKLTNDPKYAADFAKYMDGWTKMDKTSKGLAYYLEWGPLRYSANTAFLALLAADLGINAKAYRTFAMSQIHYILGDCCGGIDAKTKLPAFSYIIGYGNNYPKAPHHRAASCDAAGNCTCTTEPHPNVLYGAMVGGPDKDDSYIDDCQDYMHNEVAVDYNAGFQSAIAALKHLSILNQLPPAP